MYHTVNMQILNSQNTKLINNPTGLLMNEVLPFPGYAFMYSSNNLAPFFPFGRAFFGLRQLALRFSQNLFFLAKELRIVNLFAGRKSSKRVKANINTNSFVIFRQRHRLPFARKHNVPFTGRRPFNCAGFNLSFNRTVQNNLDVTYLRKTQNIFVKTESALREGEAVIPATPTKTGIARLLTGFYSAEEGFKGKVNTDGDVLKNLRMYAGQRFALLFKVGKVGLLTVQRQGITVIFPGIFSLFKEMVKQPATFLKPTIHYIYLFFGWVDTVQKCFTHNINYNTKEKERQGQFIPMAEARGFLGPTGVKGVLLTTFALLDLSNIRAFLGSHGISGLPYLFNT